MTRHLGKGPVSNGAAQAGGARWRPWWAWVPARAWTCPRCAAVTLSDEAGPRCPLLAWGSHGGQSLGHRRERLKLNLLVKTQLYHPEQGSGSSWTSDDSPLPRKVD